MDPKRLTMSQPKRRPEESPKPFTYARSSETCLQICSKPLSRGRHIDLYVPSAAEAKAFGKKTVRVRLLEVGEGKQDVRDEDVPVRQSPRAE
ncbi:MAG: hypothetical protein JWO48_2668 [Bryobacterales bacterium]|nr:hypothetical protein [Bryobacterales bacterium]